MPHRGIQGDSAAGKFDFIEPHAARILDEGDTFLTDIECKVLDCAATGMTIDQTAAFRGVSRNTVMTQRSSVLRKIGARNMAEAVAKGYELGLLGTL